MENAISKAKGGSSLVPTGTELKEAGMLAGGIALGIIAVHSAGKFVPKLDTPIVHGVLLAGGFLGVSKVKHPLFKALCAGAAVYGGLRLAAKAVAVVTQPGAETTSGVVGAISGVIPEGVKDSLRKFIPTFAGIEEVAGLGLGEVDDDEMNGLSLDDLGLDNIENATYEEMNGLGAAIEMPSLAA